MIVNSDCDCEFSSNKLKIQRLQVEVSALTAEMIVIVNSALTNLSAEMIVNCLE